MFVIAASDLEKLAELKIKTRIAVEMIGGRVAGFAIGY